MAVQQNKQQESRPGNLLKLFHPEQMSPWQGDFSQGFRAHTAVCRHRGQEVSPAGAPEPCSLGNTNEPQGESKENESQENNRE